MRKIINRAISKKITRIRLINPRMAIIKIYTKPHGGFMRKNSKKCPMQFEKVFDEHLEHMKSRGYKERTIVESRYSLIKTLSKFDKAGMESITQITPADIYSAFENDRHFSTPLRHFLRYLFKNKIINTDYSIYVPSIKCRRPVPSIYTKSETAKLLKCIDTSTDFGLRSYAIIILALRLGLRTGDIVGLKISNVDFINKEVHFYQEKTQVPQRLELLPEVEKALSAYISTARPIPDVPNLFLSIDKPFKPITQGIVYYCVNSHIEKAGIDPGERKRGAHSLRSTLASELISENVPYDVVRKILGHDDPIAIKHYVKFDIKALRSCALKVPPITGKLAERMALHSGVKSYGV